MKEITADELKQTLDAKENLFILDVREEDELEYGKIKGSVNIPMREIGNRWDEVPNNNNKIIVVCRSGARSAHVAKFMNTNGYDAYNLKGGILAWKKYDDSIIPY